MSEERDAERWRGMGQTIGHGQAAEGGEESGERSGVPSSSGNASTNYLVLPDGEVIPIGGEEEESEEEKKEKEEEEQTEEEEKEQEELAQWIFFHTPRVRRSELNEPTTDFIYIPPPNCDLLAVMLVAADDSGFAPAEIPLTLNGEKADSVLTQGSFRSGWLYIFNSPEGGTVSIDNTGLVGIATQNYVVFPISFKNQGGTPLIIPSFARNDKSAGVLKIESTYNIGTLPGVSVTATNRRNPQAAENPPKSIDRSGVQLGNVIVKDNVINFRAELAVQLVPPGSTKRFFEWDTPNEGFGYDLFTYGIREEVV
jgi:hypothetical protein